MKNLKDYLNSLNNKQLEVVLNNSKELIVPAGAGSGKTKTLVTKVIHLLKQNEKLDSFLVLTFTNKAAKEMKDRIKKELKENNLEELVNKVDSSNIQTFDSFAYNFVKQNAIYINLDSNIELLDDSIFRFTKKQIFNELIAEYMISDDINKQKFIYDFIGVKQDNILIDSLINTYDKIKNTYNGFDINLKDLYINNKIDIKIIEDKLYSISKEFVDENNDNLNYYFDQLNHINNYEEIEKSSKVIRLQKKKIGLSDNQSDEIEKVLSKIKDLIKFNPSNKILKEYNEITNNYLEQLNNLLHEFDKRLLQIKKETNKYEFIDIANFLNKILKENNQILERLKRNIKYIFVDEFQDTSKVQSDFLELLIKDNKNLHVLYVGDIKQSIYKFRNAKPETFVHKQKTVDQIKLCSNYRSHRYIIDFVNNVFSKLLNDEIKYDINYLKDQHEMDSKNTKITDENSGVYYIEYAKTAVNNSKYLEPFIVGTKIKELINNKQIKKYSDIAILARNKTNFKNYIDVFNYLNIPLQVQIDQDISKTYLLKLISNILILSLYLEDNTKEKYELKRFCLLSILRSELYNKTDEEIFDYLIKDNQKSLIIPNDIYLKLKEINKLIYTSTNYQIIDKTVELFEIYKKIIYTNDFNLKELQIEYLYNISKTLQDLNINSKNFVEYINDFAYNDEEIKTKVLQEKEENSVKLTNIHQSKGLEYNTVFVIELGNKFKQGRKTPISYNDYTKIILNPYYESYNNKEELKALNEVINLKSKYINEKENLKEELRLLYVAFTRAEKSLYLVSTPPKDVLNSYISYLDSINFLKYIDEDKISKKPLFSFKEDFLSYIKEPIYTYPKEIDLLKDINFDIKKELINDKKSSITINNIIDEKTKENLKQGTKLHEIFEFSNLEEEIKETDNIYIKNIKKTKFNNKYLFQSINIYKEFEFNYIDEKDNNIIGIIDLLVEYIDEIHIIDYKTKNIDIDKYKNQLLSYYNYIKKITNKKIKIYLYSIMDNKIEEVSIN